MALCTKIVRTSAVAAVVFPAPEKFGTIFLKHQDQRATNPPEFAQPRLSRVKGPSSPAREYKFGCVCSYIATHYLRILVTGDIGTNTPKFVPPRWRRPRFDPTQTRLCKCGWVWSSLTRSAISLLSRMARMAISSAIIIGETDPHCGNSLRFLVGR